MSIPADKITDGQFGPQTKAALKPKIAVDRRVLLATSAALTFLGWTIVVTLLGIAFGAWLSALGWRDYNAGMVGVFLWLVTWIGVPLVAGAIWNYVNESMRTERLRQEALQRDDLARLAKERIWDEGARAGGSFWRRKFSDEPDLIEAAVLKNPYRKDI